MEQVRVRISAAIANEWSNRAITDVVPELPEYDIRGGWLIVSVSVAREILEDCEFNGDAKNGPEEMPGGTRRAYRALAQQVRGVLQGAEQANDKRI